MIYGKSLSFNEIIDKMTQLNDKINRLEWQQTPVANIVYMP